MMRSCDHNGCIVIFQDVHRDGECPVCTEIKERDEHIEGIMEELKDLRDKMDILRATL